LRKSATCKQVAWHLPELQSTLQVKRFPVHGEKLNIVLMCVIPLMVSILRSSGHIRNFESSSVWKWLISPVYFMVEDILFYFIAV
jgi:hypothetical protein